MVPGLHGAFFSSLLSSASNVTGKKKKKKSKKFLQLESGQSSIFNVFFFSTFKKLGLRFPTICFARQHLANEDQTS